MTLVVQGSYRVGVGRSAWVPVDWRCSYVVKGGGKTERAADDAVKQPRCRGNENDDDDDDDDGRGLGHALSSSLYPTISQRERSREDRSCTPFRPRDHRTILSVERVTRLDLWDIMHNYVWKNHLFYFTRTSKNSKLYLISKYHIIFF